MSDESGRLGSPPTKLLWGAAVVDWLAEREDHEHARRHGGEQDAHPGLCPSLHVDSPFLAPTTSGETNPSLYPR